MRSPSDELDDLRAQHLFRELLTVRSPQGASVEIDGRQLINFSSNDYLGLASSSFLKDALQIAVAQWGAGSGASRLVCGTLAPHHDLESLLAAFKSKEAALTFSSGYAAAVGTITALIGKNDVIILDKLSHASLIDGARLSGATMRVFPHNDLDKLESHLRWARGNTGPDDRVLVMTESVFSMDGDASPLGDIVRLKNEHGALLLLDEAHAFGVIGPGGRGLAAGCGVAEQVDIHMGTLSKAAGLSGGFVCASRPIVDLLINRARSFIYSTAPPPAIAAAALESLRVIRSGEGDLLRQKLRANIDRLTAALATPDRPLAPAAAIVPYLIGDEQEALDRASALRDAGFLVPAIRFPTVPRSRARLRLALTANHTPDQIDALCQTLCAPA